MPGAKYTETYKKVSAMGEKLKAAGKQGPSNDEQLHVRICLFFLFTLALFYPFKVYYLKRTFRISNANFLIVILVVRVRQGSRGQGL
jgi:hypothetical protein